MANITSMTIPKYIIRKARELNINCSQTSRDALVEAIRKKDPSWSPEGAAESA